MELLSKAELAEKIGRHRSYVSAMARAGLKFSCGRIAMKDALAWMAANPDFRMRDAYVRETTPKVTRRKCASGIRLSERV